MKPARAYGALAAIFVAGFVTFGWSWHGATIAKYVPLQVPWIISGGLAGVALVGLAAASWHIYVCKRADDRHRADWGQFTKELVDALSVPELVE